MCHSFLTYLRAHGITDPPIRLPNTFFLHSPSDQMSIRNVWYNIYPIDPFVPCWRTRKNSIRNRLAETQSMERIGLQASIPFFLFFFFSIPRFPCVRIFKLDPRHRCASLHFSSNARKRRINKEFFYSLFVFRKRKFDERERERKRSNDSHNAIFPLWRRLRNAWSRVNN